MLIALLTTIVTLAVHSIAYTYFIATGKWAKEVVHVYQLPEWINDQAKKNKRKAFRFEFWSMTLIAVTAWLGAASDTQGSTHSGTWRSPRGRSALTLGRSWSNMQPSCHMPSSSSRSRREPTSCAGIVTTPNRPSPEI